MRRLALLALLLPLLAGAATPCTDACKTLVDEGNVLVAQGKRQQAYQKYQAAIAAAPEATVPLLAASAVLLDLSWHSAEPQATKVHAMADGLARQALHLEPGNALAQDVLRQIADGPPVVLHQPVPAAAQAMAQAETLYAQGRFDDARKQYELVMALDPRWSAAWVGAGDACFGQQDWPHAEALYRRATEIEPRNPEAWRYLADSLLRQGKTGPGEQALYGAIAANPADRNTWGKLASLRAHMQRPLTALHVERGIAAGADGPPWPGDLAAWRAKLQASGATADPALRQLQALANDGQLEPALLILAYRPPYRAAFDAWLAAHPDGVKAFIDRYSLQP